MREGERLAANDAVLKVALTCRMGHFGTLFIPEVMVLDVPKWA